MIRKEGDIAKASHQTELRRKAFIESKALIEEVLSRRQLSKKEAAQILEISPANLNNKLSKSTLRIYDLFLLLNELNLELEIKEKPLFQANDYHELLDVIGHIHKELVKQQKATIEILKRLSALEEEKDTPKND